MRHSGFWYFFVDSLDHTIWGFCCYKPLWITQWWKTHSPCSKLGLGDEIVHPHHSTLITDPPIDLGSKQGRTAQEFPVEAHHHLKKRSIQPIRRAWGYSGTWVLLAGSQLSFWRFSWRVITIRSSVTDWDGLEARRTSCDSLFLRYRVFYLESGHETSPKGLS